MAFLDYTGLARFKSKIDTLLAGKLDTSLKGAAGGLAELDSNGKIPSECMPDSIDSIMEYEDFAHFPAEGESGVIYIALDTNISYRWGGTVYVAIASDLALGETSSTAYRGDRGAAAYAHGVTNKGIAATSGFYKITTNSEGHVTAVTAVALSDLTALGAAAATDLTDLYRQFWNSTTSVQVNVATNGKTYLIWSSGSSAGTAGALMDSNNGALIVLSNGRYAVLHKGANVTVSVASSVLTVSCTTNVAMAIVEL